MYDITSIFINLLSEINVIMFLWSILNMAPVYFDYDLWA